METIIVPTDFSNASINAFEYALELSKVLSGRIILLNAYHPLLPPGYDSHYDQDPSAVQKESVMARLEQLKKNIFKKHGRAYDVECRAEMGFSYDVIDSAAKREVADIIVMGIVGEAGPIKKHVIGSTALDVARNQSTPVFIVPECAAYRRIEKISFACDFERTEETTLIYQVQSFAKLFEAELEIVNVSSFWNSLTLAKAVTNYFVERDLRNVKHQTVHIDGENVSHELENYFNENATDLIILNPRRHNLFYQLFNYSITKEMAFRSKVPVLTIH